MANPANSRLLNSLEYRAGTLDSLEHQFKGESLRIWMPVFDRRPVTERIGLGKISKLTMHPTLLWRQHQSKQFSAHLQIAKKGCRQGTETSERRIC
jgi:hypothetical protein